MTTSIAGLLLGARRIEVVVVITLLLLDVLLHMEVEGQEGNGRGRFLILRMVVQKGAMVAVLGKAAAYQVLVSSVLEKIKTVSFRLVVVMSQYLVCTGLKIIWFVCKGLSLGGYFSNHLVICWTFSISRVAYQVKQVLNMRLHFCDRSLKGFFLFYA